MIVGSSLWTLLCRCSGRLRWLCAATQVAGVLSILLLLSVVSLRAQQTPQGAVQVDFVSFLVGGTGEEIYFHDDAHGLIPFTLQAFKRSDYIYSYRGQNPLVFYRKAKGGAAFADGQTGQGNLPISVGQAAAVRAENETNAAVQPHLSGDSVHVGLEPVGSVTIPQNAKNVLLLFFPNDQGEYRIFALRNDPGSVPTGAVRLINVSGSQVRILNKKAGVVSLESGAASVFPSDNNGMVDLDVVLQRDDRWQRVLRNSLGVGKGEGYTALLVDDDTGSFRQRTAEGHDLVQASVQMVVVDGP